MRTAEIRRRYLDFFARHQHAVVPSAPLVHHDPTLLFVNAGMVPFKPYFTGDETAPWSRAVSAQKCVRTLDIEDVGKTTRHGTFFQMLGNFSFGDYFKAEAIQWAWEFVTGSVDDGCLGFDPSLVWVTVLGPGHHPDYPDGDAEAAAHWEALGVPADHIQRRGLEDNYWNMGVPGPGGPCSEIYIDRGPEHGADGGPEADEDRFLEIWNLVFQTEDLSVVRAKDDFDIAGQLPSRNIDTGAGLERIAYLLQGKNNLYEIDEVFPVIARAEELSGRRYGAHQDDDVRLRVVADHIRSSLMLMTDGVTPGNEGRGYVLRRLLRRAIRAMRLLGVTEPVLPELLPVSRDLMTESYPEITTGWERTAQVAYAEEESFRRTLTSGSQLFDAAVQRLRDTGGAELSGAEAFTLHDTHGFPLDLTIEMAAEQGLTVDREGFAQLMAEQRDRAKADARAKKGAAQHTEAYREIRSLGESLFAGYTRLDLESRIVGLIRDGATVPVATTGDTVEIVLEQTPFYAESGGQTADTGVLDVDGGQARVEDVQSPLAGLIVHRCTVSSGELRAGQTVHARVDPAHRRDAAKAHSATHLIHAALREIVGPTATQAGSLNRPGYLRFDFSAQQGLSEDMKQQIEGRTNEQIAADHEVTTTVMPLSEAKALGALAMFGEKYADEVRVVEMDGPWSRELCGGTHVQHSAQIGLVNLVSESSIGSGVRRVEAYVGQDALDHFVAERSLVTGLTDMLKVKPDQLTDRVSRLLDQIKQAEKEITRLRSQQTLAQAGQLLEGATDHHGVRVLTRHLPGVAGGDLRTLAMDLRDRLGEVPGVIALIGGSDDKPTMIVATTAAARDRGLAAGTLLQPAVAALGGRGGGKPDLAQGGGSDVSQVETALATITDAIDRA